jgi:hypothetical protein
LIKKIGNAAFFGLLFGAAKPIGANSPVSKHQGFLFAVFNFVVWLIAQIWLQVRTNT